MSGVVLGLVCFGIAVLAFGAYHCMGNCILYDYIFVVRALTGQ
jgi:hypothetical protein